MSFPTLAASRLLYALVLALILVAPAAAQDLFVQVDLELNAGGEESAGGCSILRVSPGGMLTEWVSNDEILAATGETTADCDDTDIAAGPDGTLYFAEDVSHDILRVDTAGNVSVFVDAATIDAVVGTTSDIDNGMDFGSDGNLYAADEDCNCIIRITVPGGMVTVEVTEVEIEAVFSGTDVDPNGGLARRDDGALFFTQDNDPNTIFAVSPLGVVSVLAEDTDIETATGDTSTDLDLGIALSGGNLFVLEDSSGSVLQVATADGAVSVLADEAAIIAATGADGSDSEGGIAVGPGGDLFVGDDGFSDSLQRDLNHILRITQAGAVSVFVDDAAVNTLYDSLYPGATSRFEGGMVFAAVGPRVRGIPMNVPALGPVGLILLALLLAGLGLAFRRWGMGPI